MIVTPQGAPPILIPLTPTSPGCSQGPNGLSCVANVSLPVGTYTIQVALYGLPNGTGDPLALVAATETIAPDVTNSLNLTLNAVVSLVFLSLSPNGALTSGTPATRTVVVTAQDPDGATIVVGRDALVDRFGSPLTIDLGVTDTTGSVSVSPAVAGNTPITLSYNGGTPNGTNVTAMVRNASNVLVTQAQTSFTLGPGGTTGPLGPTTTYYVQDMRRATLLAAGQTMRSEGRSGLVILDFGIPYYCDSPGVPNLCSSAQVGNYGSFLPPGGAFVTVADITAATEAYLDGFAGNNPPAGGQQLVLAIGTNNYCKYQSDCLNIDSDNPQVTFRSYGTNWGAMVANVQSYVIGQGRGSFESVAAANDIETWCQTTNSPAVCTVGPQPTKDWLAGYSSLTSQPMFNYGSLDGCEVPNACLHWGPLDFWEMSSTQNYYALPEIYCPGQITDWVNLAVWTQTTFGQSLRVAGTLTSSTLPPPGSPSNPCVTPAYQPLEGFNDLYNRLLQSAPGAAAGMKYATDIQFLSP
jgi:hypothetical protein